MKKRLLMTDGRPHTGDSAHNSQRPCEVPDNAAISLKVLSNNALAWKRRRRSPVIVSNEGVYSCYI